MDNRGKFAFKATRWTQEETQDLINYYNQGLVPMQIAKQINRRCGSIETKIKRLQKQKTLSYRRK